MHENRKQTTLVTWTAIVTWVDDLGRTRNATCTGVTGESVREWGEYYRLERGRAVAYRLHRNTSEAWKHVFAVTGG